MDLHECRKRVFGSLNGAHANRFLPILRFRQMTLAPHFDDFVLGKYHFERNKKAEKKIPVATFRCRRHRILLFVAFVWRLATLDEWNLLPTGLLMLYAGITITIEEFSKEFQQQQAQEEFFLQQRIMNARFEYHILRGDSKARIVSRLETDGSTTLYAI